MATAIQLRFSQKTLCIIVYVHYGLQACWWHDFSPTSKSCHQLISSPTSVTTIDVAFTMWQKCPVVIWWRFYIPEYLFSSIFKFSKIFQKQQQNRKKRPDLPKEWQPNTGSNGPDQYFQIRNFEEIHVFKDSNLSDDEDELEGPGSQILSVYGQLTIDSCPWLIIYDPRLRRQTWIRGA